MNLQRSLLQSPIGTIVLVTRGRRRAPGGKSPERTIPQEPSLCALGFEDLEAELLHEVARRFGRAPLEDGPVPSALGARLASYFAGDLTALDAITVEAPGTPFQTRVWTALRAIAPGATTSYSALAAAVGAPRAVRAVGSANARNLLPLVIPCHRVIRSDGSLCGYAGGLARKEWLLVHERARADRPRAASLPS